MSHQKNDNKFIFNENIDKDFLHSLYEEDYVYMSEVFSTCRDSITEDIQTLEEAFQQGDVRLVQKAAHKLKPVFGFTGLLIYQDALGQLETACLNASDLSMLKKEYHQVLQLVMEGKTIIEQECKKLQQFTGIIV